MKKNILIIALAILGFGGIIYAAPSTTYAPNLLPDGNQTRDLGTTTPALEWNNVYTKNLTVSGTCTGCGAVSTFSFTTTTNYGVTVNATGTPLWLQSGLMASTTSYLATTTFSGSVRVPDGAEGLPSIVFGTEANTGFHLQSAGVIDVNVPSQFRVDINGSASIYDFQSTQFLPSPNATNKLGAFGYAWNGVVASSTSYFDNSSTTQATITDLWATNLTVAGLTSALTLTNGSGVFAEYTGTSCTNQFVRSLSALGVATCATVGSADVSLAELTATNSTLTFSGTYNGSTARTIGLNLGNANAWTALQEFSNASTTQISAGTGDVFYVDSTGRITAKDTTKAWSGVVSPTRKGGFNIATSTATWTSTSTPGVDSTPFQTMDFAGTARTIQCKFNTFLGVNIKIAGTDITPSYFVASSTAGTIEFTANNTFTSGQELQWYIGTTTSATAGSGVVNGSCMLNITETQ